MNKYKKISYIVVSATSIVLLEAGPFVLNKKEEIHDLPSTGGFSYDFPFRTASISGAISSTLTAQK